VQQLSNSCAEGNTVTNEGIAVELTNHNDRLIVVEQGVSNYRKFQQRMEEYMNKQLGFQRSTKWFVGISVPIFVVILTWFLSAIIPAAKLIMDDYYRNHPSSVYHRSESTNQILQSSSDGRINLSDGTDR
jgi:hypothetical protein